MLQTLPPEVLQQVIGHLPSASAIVNLSLVNHEFHGLISVEDYAVFRPFVQKWFPTIDVPPLWRDAARVLTSRSRAWDRWALVARECQPPPDSLSERFELTSGQKYGYIPTIDSYETWNGSSWNDRTEVVAWSAAGRLRTRITNDKSVRWISTTGDEDHLAQNDILDIRILRPHQRESLDRETVIFRRANGKIIKAESQPDQNVFNEKSNFEIGSSLIDSIDVNSNAEPILAAVNAESILLFKATDSETKIKPMDSAKFDNSFSQRHRKRSAKFISDTSLVMGLQFLEGRERAPINIYDISSSGLSETPLTATSSFSATSHPWRGRHSANVIAPLDSLSSKPGEIFLSGWTDGIARLYDCRAPLTAVSEYVDAVDDGQILSLLPIGHERFLAGSHQNACLKTFDLRMPGAKPYSYLNARLGPDSEDQKSCSVLHSEEENRREINIFLSINFQQRRNQRRNPIRHARYSSSIYHLSSPSSSSPRVYAGLENHVLELDFVSTDDLTSKTTSLADPLINLETEKADGIFNVSCYERPRQGWESTDTIKLRNQINWSDVVRLNQDPEFRSKWGIEDYWDDRWRLAALDWENERGQNWRSNRRR